MRGLQDPELDALLREEFARARAVKVGERGERSCLEASPAQDRDRARRLLDWPARLGIQDVPQPFPIPHHVAPRIAARREPAARKLDSIERGDARLIRVVHADSPWLSLSPRRARKEIAAEIDEHGDAGYR